MDTGPDDLYSGTQVSFWGRTHPKLPSLGCLLLAAPPPPDIIHISLRDRRAEIFALRLGVPLPGQWFDTFVAQRRVTNRPGLPPVPGLSAALHQAGLPHMAPAAKQDLRQRLARLEIHPVADRDLILNYCRDDAADCAALYPTLVSRIDPVIMAHWCEFLKVYPGWSCAVSRST